MYPCARFFAFPHGVCVCVCVCAQGMWLILQQEKPADYVLATGEMHTVREFVVESFKYVGVAIE